MHEKRVARAYHTELWVAIGVYIVLLVGSIRLARPMADGTLRTVLLLLPMLGFALMIRAIVRHVARIDEYQRLRMLESIGIAFAVTGALTFSYGFLETAGFPKMSMFVVWMVMCASWGVVNLVRTWSGR
ncbi:hypothetical protein [Herbaspirillum sp. SJZ107]|uniref:hypothetical protein n=1 Tax=Herbaspirillum sp. SJZ107 TaxID=2572881 RepID=UPI001154F3B7|nr:hypothetical protein [Herbaspirillum sp. SJZ107]TQK11451.1 hypothetical protein FBX97_1394 [Herbaspirillum sp. SJZ107]